MTRHLDRSVSVAASFAGAVFNLVVAVRLLALWRSLGWESESEWEASGDVWRIDGVKIVWGLLSTYFAAAALACFVGFVGLTKSIPSFVRFYRDYSIADFAFVTASTLLVSYKAFSAPYVRTGVCEELSRHPDLMRDMVEMGLSQENCELWFERAVVALLGITFILMVIRLHTLLALSKYYRHVSRDAFNGSKSHAGLRSASPDSLQRIYLLPTPTSPVSSSMPFNHHFGSAAHSRSNSDAIIVYAPVPVGGVSEQEARKMNATEAWIPSRASADVAPGTGNSARMHRHTRSASCHSHRYHGVTRQPGVRREGVCTPVDEKAETGPLF
ncbi:uncharacterized protein LAESUDRAFT_718868 [Laetiporus sulphureus 93-53]|uniref:Uncharacterized protein n=1 Tax=Laetiporus sulphureus 93-53 TaxID=1314785 RepID=A0A165I4R3_9APHY|nr:uncharacterized protein LAESUDRAFT_718868 [Laetiporus sulphureus 93-53]KZT12592.1 hypothetical protein LAESUDRAFT_718868 [Laetiporus sulphureus 93-53]